MKSEYKVQCEHCEKMTGFGIDEVNGLDGDIESEIEWNRADAAAEFEGMVEPDELLDKRLLQDLSSAIYRGEIMEAGYLLEKLAAELGSEATEYVQRGRFSMRAVA